MSLASRVEQSTAFRRTARAGYAVSGLLHVLIGIIALSTAFGVAGRADQTGALRAIASVPAGFVLLWAMVVALLALALWRVANGFTVHETDLRKRWTRRLSEWGQAIGYLAIALLAAGVAVDGRAGGGAEAITAQLLAVPGGVVLIVAVGLAVLGGGIWFIVKGVLRRFLTDLKTPPTRVRPAIEAFGVFGHVAKGLALAVLGILIVVAAVTADPQRAGGLDQAFSALATLPFGAVLIGLVGVGFIAYGVYCGFRTRFANL